MFDGRTVLVTGGTGSLGQVLVRRLLSGEAGMPSKVVVLSRDEAKQHAMRQRFLRRSVTTDESIYRNFARTLEFRLGDVRDYRDVLGCVRDADVVVNAAALKQVPTCEYFPEQAVATNCDGAANVVRAVRDCGYRVEVVVGVSTDKACRPVNVMGMTKAVQERIFVAANIGSLAAGGATRFVVVRYGNVLASRGSVVPLFLDQIASGGPVTVTAPEMTRFLITLESAVDMIMHAVATARHGEILAPVTPSATVINIARALIGDRDVAVEVTGIRPGEKLHEVLVSQEEASRTERDGHYFVVAPMLPELGAEPSTGSTSPAGRDLVSSESPPAGRALESRPAGPALISEYSSADTVVDLHETSAILAGNRLLPGQQTGGHDRLDEVSAELLR